VVSENASIGPRTILHPRVTVYRDARIGADCELHSGVSVREGTRIGDRVLIHDNAVIGADGFGFAKDASQGGAYVKIPQVGHVEIEDDVEIGALSAIDRASMGVTRVKRGTKIDNLVQIGHSVEVGENSVLCAQVGIAGSSKVGARAVLAGQVGVADHVTIEDDVIASGQSGVHGHVAKGARVSGTPAIDGRTWLRASAATKQLPDLVQRIRELEAQVEEFRAKLPR
jgi:UDP-3-O-[3-hydroxymyristoyl] glucosamine N-acyltransferase